MRQLVSELIIQMKCWRFNSCINMSRYTLSQPTESTKSQRPTENRICELLFGWATAMPLDHNQLDQLLWSLIFCPEKESQLVRAWFSNQKVKTEVDSCNIFSVKPSHIYSLLSVAVYLSWMIYELYITDYYTN